MVPFPKPTSGVPLSSALEAQQVVLIHVLNGGAALCLLQSMAGSPVVYGLLSDGSLLIVNAAVPVVCSHRVRPEQSLSFFYCIPINLAVPYPKIGAVGTFTSHL